MMKFADVHSHFVYGVDDGAKTQEEMKAMLDAAWQDDVTTLVATPHRTPGVHPFDEALFERRLAEARDYCQLRSYAMNLWGRGGNSVHPGVGAVYDLPSAADAWLYAECSD